MAQWSPVFAAPMGRDDAIRKALTTNPELAVARHEIRVAETRLKWAGRLSNPELEIGLNDDFLGSNDNENGVEIAFVQQFPITSRLEGERELGRRHVDLAWMEFAIRQRELAYEVDKAWLVLAAARESISLRTRQRDLNRDVVEFLEGGSAVGEASSLDAAQASLAGRLLAQQIGQAEREALIAESALRQLLGMPSGTAIVLSAAPKVPAKAPKAGQEVSIRKAIESSPELAAIEAKIAAAEAKLDLADARRWEDVALRVFLEREHSVDQPDGRGRNTFAGISLSIPLPIRDTNQAGIAEAELDLDRARLLLAAQTHLLDSQLDAAVKNRAALHRLAASATGETLKLAEQNVGQFRDAQESGQASLLQVQQAQRQWLELETGAIELRNAYLLADAEMRFLTGTYPIPANQASSETSTAK